MRACERWLAPATRACDSARCDDDRGVEHAPRPQRFGVLLTVLTTAFIVSGIDRPWAQVMGVALTALMVIVGFRNAGYSTSRPLLVILLTVVLSATLMSASLRDESQWSAIPMFLQAGVLALLVWMAVGAALRRAVVDMQTILAAISAYVLIGFVYAWGYLGVAGARRQPVLDAGVGLDGVLRVQLRRPDHARASATSFPCRRSQSRLVVTQAVIGQMFLATLVARLVSLYGTNAATALDGSTMMS